MRYKFVLGDSYNTKRGGERAKASERLANATGHVRATTELIARRKVRKRFRIGQLPCGSTFEPVGEHSRKRKKIAVVSANGNLSKQDYTDLIVLSAKSSRHDLVEKLVSQI